MKYFALCTATAVAVLLAGCSQTAPDTREADAKAWHNVSVSTDAEDVKGLPDLKF